MMWTHTADPMLAYLIPLRPVEVKRFPGLLEKNLNLPRESRIGLQANSMLLPEWT